MREYLLVKGYYFTDEEMRKALTEEECRKYLCERTRYNFKGLCSLTENTIKVIFEYEEKIWNFS